MKIWWMRNFWRKNEGKTNKRKEKNTVARWFGWWEGLCFSEDGGWGQISVENKTVEMVVKDLLLGDNQKKKKKKSKEEALCVTCTKAVVQGEIKITGSSRQGRWKAQDRKDSLRFFTVISMQEKLLVTINRLVFCTDSLLCRVGQLKWSQLILPIKMHKRIIIQQCYFIKNR